MVWCLVVMFWLRLVTGWLCKWLILLGNLRAVYGWRQKSPCVHLPPTILFKYLKKKLNTKTGPPPSHTHDTGGRCTVGHYWQLLDTQECNYLKWLLFFSPYVSMWWQLVLMWCQVVPVMCVHPASGGDIRVTVGYRWLQVVTFEGCPGGYVWCPIVSRWCQVYTKKPATISRYWPLQVFANQQVKPSIQFVRHYITCKAQYICQS